ncbi:peptidoglycan DD-metalloendopeptidase family protein [Nocardia sp. NPDC004068]|uniref:peptidoglycan DD-metalloendopeptidase family protein n=1 Tax=Nocardia sp. NPDC004068 TaxID=3364303 RepID=UPI0036970476
MDSGPTRALVIVGVVVAAAGLLLIGVGERKPADPHCLPNMPQAPRQQPVSSGQAVIPLPAGSYTVSSPFGPRDGGFHRGVDLAAPQGTPILAAMDGTVAAAGPASGFGNWIVVDSQRPEGLVSTVYGHMFDDGVLVHTSDVVHAGQQIGAVGSAGEANGAHLHFEVWPGGRFHGGDAVDPMPWLQAVPSPETSSPVRPVAVADDARRTSRSRRLANIGGRQVGCEPVSSNEPLLAGSVPPEFEPWIRKAAAQCPELSEAILAAQLRQESGFNRWARSPAGALGPAQFMPGTWAGHGVDGDGDGTVDVFSIADAVVSQGKYACELIDIAKKGLAEGRLHGELTELWLSMYNCGAQNTLDQGGVCQNAETLGYVRTIPELATHYASPSHQ